LPVVRGALQRVGHNVLRLHGWMVKPALFHVAYNPAFLALPNVGLERMNHVFRVRQVVRIRQWRRVGLVPSAQLPAQPLVHRLLHQGHELRFAAKHQPVFKRREHFNVKARVNVSADVGQVLAG